MWQKTEGTAPKQSLMGAKAAALAIALICFSPMAEKSALAAPSAVTLADEAAIRFRLGDDAGVARVLHPLLQNSNSAARVSGQAVLRAADTLWSQGDSSRAWDLYQSVANQAAPKERGVALARLMQIAVKLGLWQEFAEFDRAFAQLNSRVPQRLHVLRAKVLYAQGRDGQALRELTNVKRGHSSFWSAQYLRGALRVRLYRSYRGQGEYKKAQKALRQALQAFDDIVAAGDGEKNRVSSTSASQNAQKNKPMQEVWEKAVLAQARVLQQQGKFHAAIKLYTRISKDSLRRSDALYESALAWKLLGDRAQRQAKQSQNPSGGTRHKKMQKKLRKQARTFYDQAGQSIRRLQEQQAFICHPRRLGALGQATRFCSNGGGDDSKASRRIWGVRLASSSRNVRVNNPTQWVLAARVAHKRGLLGRAGEIYDNILSTYGPLLSALKSGDATARARVGKWLRENTAVSIPSTLQERYRVVARMQRQLQTGIDEAKSSKAPQAIQTVRFAERIRALEAGIDEELAKSYKPSVVSAVRLAKRGQVDLIVDEKKLWTRGVELIQQQRNVQVRRTDVLLSDLKDGGGQ